MRSFKSFPSKTGDGEGRFLALARNGKLGRTAKQAIIKQREAGLPITSKKGNAVIQEFPDGRVEFIGIIPKQKRRRPRIGAIVKP